MTTWTAAVRLLAAGAVGALALAGCGGGTDEGSSPLSTAATTTTTILPATTTTTPRATTSTTRPGATPTTSVRVTTPPRAPTYVEGVPQVRASPPRGPVGTRVHIEGDGFTDEQWKASGTTLWLTGSPSGCALYAEAAHTVRVTAGGHLSGDFTVPAQGVCRQSDIGDAPVAAGRYTIAFQCTACFVGDFEVTAG